MTDLDAGQTLAAYDAIAPIYGEYAKRRQAYLDAVDDLVVSRLRQGMRLLDVGAGDGRRLQKIRSSVGLTSCIAVEPSPAMARLCRARTGAPVYEVRAENLGDIDIGRFDAVIALWNVFGHVSSEARLPALINLRNMLEDGGRIFLDVNNRHNAAAYGRLNVFWRRFVDTVQFKEERGNAFYKWEVDGRIFQSTGHLFTPAEIEDLFRKAGLLVVERMSLDYATGMASPSKYRGQLFYVLTPGKRISAGADRSF